MKRLIIIVEGDTEKEFVNRVLYPFLLQKGVHTISCYKISKTNGGLRNYVHLKRDIQKAINEDNVTVTTLVDYYALPENFPKYYEAQQIPDKSERATFLEQAIVADIQGDRYIPFLTPYIQLHEFEALTLTDISGFRYYFDEPDADFEELEKIINSSHSPEDINDGKQTAPSKRLKRLIPSYDKVTDGNNLIIYHGIERIFATCPRFKKWVEKIVEMAISSS